MNEMKQVLVALGHPRRLAIVRCMIENAAAFSTIGLHEHTGEAYTTLHYHVRALEKAGVLVVHAYNKEKFYTLNLPLLHAGAKQFLKLLPNA